MVVGTWEHARCDFTIAAAPAAQQLYFSILGILYSSLVLARSFTGAAVAAASLCIPAIVVKPLTTIFVSYPSINFIYNKLQLLLNLFYLFHNPFIPRGYGPRLLGRRA